MPFNLEGRGGGVKALLVESLVEESHKKVPPLGETVFLFAASLTQMLFLFEKTQQSDMLG